MDRDTTNYIRKKAAETWKKEATRPYEANAKIVSTGAKPMVLIDGATEPTEATVFMGSKRGDRVKVAVSHSGVEVIGNATSPATDNTVANRAYKMADNVKSTVADAYRQANDAYSMADAAKSIVGDMKEDVDSALDAAIEAERIANGVEGKVDQSLAKAESALEKSKDAMERSTAVEQTVHSLNVRTTVGDEQSLVRAHMGGVLVGKVGQNPCAYVNNSGSFDVVSVDWEQVRVMDASGSYTGEVRSEPIVRGTTATFGHGTAIREFNESGELLHEARMTPSEFVIENAEVSRYMRIGAYAWKPRMDGSMSLLWE